MELYLVITLFFIYLITAALSNKLFVKRLWTVAFISAFIITSIAIVLVRISQQDVMLQADNLNWYYILYLFSSLSAALGLINLWMYRGALWHLFFDENSKQ